MHLSMLGVINRFIGYVKMVLMTVVVLWGLTVSSYAAPIISDLKVTSVEPLGIAIDYIVSGAEVTDAKHPIEVSMTAVGDTYIAQHLSGATNCVNGTHRVYWNMANDGFTLDVTNAAVKVTYKAYVPPTDGALFCVIDLSGGSSADTYPIAYLDAEPSETFTNTVYKTTKLVLKRVEAGTFIMGEDQTVAAFRVTLTKPFYMGLYEVTQEQWYRVMGTSPSFWQGAALPVEQVSYGGASSFLKELSRKTGNLLFDLPTEAQWEYVCRAGTTTKYSYGDDYSKYSEYMWHRGNSSGQTHEVGMKLPNDWGFYDMHGNVREWCLDWYGTLTYGTDPEGPSSGTYRMMRGGSWKGGDCTSSYRFEYYRPSEANFSGGFRISRIIP